MIDRHPATQSPRHGALALWLPVALFMAAFYYGAAVTVTAGPPGLVSDTVLHMAGYAGLAMVTLRATSGGRWAGVTPRAMAAAFAIAIVHGMTVEVEQMFVPTRSAEWRDVGNDAIGALAGLGAAWAWGKLLKK